MLFMVRQFSPHCMDFTREFIKTVELIGNAVPPELAAALLSCHL